MQAETGPLVSFLQAEYSDESKASTAGQKQPFGGNTKSPEELRAQTLENLEIFLANKAIYAVSVASQILTGIDH